MLGNRLIGFVQVDWVLSARVHDRRTLALAMSKWMSRRGVSPGGCERTRRPRGNTLRPNPAAPFPAESQRQVNECAMPLQTPAPSRHDQQDSEGSSHLYRREPRHRPGLAVLVLPQRSPPPQRRGGLTKAKAIIEIAGGVACEVGGHHSSFGSLRAPPSPSSPTAARATRTTRLGRSSGWKQSGHQR